MQLQGKFFIDGIDMWSAFGMVVESGYDTFLKFPQRKEPLTHDWQDSNGIDADLSRVFFKERTHNLNMAIVALDEADFWKKYNQFLAQVAQPGTRRFMVTELAQSFKVYYKDCTSFTKFTRIKVEDSQKVACKFVLQVIEPEPTIDNTNLFLADEEGRLIIT